VAKFKYILLSILILSSIEAKDYTSLKIEPYFSKITGKYYKDGVDNKIIYDIDKAFSSIKMAMYYLTNKHITQSLINAHKRGIKIQVVTDDKMIKKRYFQRLIDAGIKVIDDGDKYSLMHNKILIIDKDILWISSANYTVYSFYRNYDNFLKISDKKVIKYYDKKFNRLYANNRELLKPYISDKIEVYFSPDTNFENKIIDIISKAKESINFLAFAFTNSKITDALISAKNRGVKIKGVFDKAQNNYQKYSQYKVLKQNNISVILDKNPKKLHSKVIIIDKKVVITGSYNFTKKANNKNDENSIVIYDKVIAKEYINDFKKIYYSK
jgi:phosphatidylserine/phosphatidylglycerophosphate/cardiolipin synthase-like enzyme